MRNTKFLKNTLVLGLCFVATVIGVGFFNNAANVLQYNTVDDSKLLIESLDKKPSVLGANSDTEEKLDCPKEKPIIGYIEFSGNKKIVENIASGQKPSACFKNIEEAKNSGFFK